MGLQAPKVKLIANSVYDNVIDRLQVKFCLLNLEIKTIVVSSSLMSCGRLGVMRVHSCFRRSSKTCL